MRNLADAGFTDEQATKMITLPPPAQPRESHSRGLESAGFSYDNAPAEAQPFYEHLRRNYTTLLNKADRNYLDDEAIERIEVASFLSAQSSFDVQYTYNNLESVANHLIELRKLPYDWRAFTRDRWQAGQAQYESAMHANQLATMAIQGDWDESKYQLALSIAQSAPPPRQDHGFNILTQALGATAEQLPRMLGAGKRGAVTAGVVGAGTVAALALGGVPIAVAAGTAAAVGAKSMKVASIASLAQGYAGSTFLEIDGYEMADGTKVDRRIAAVASKAVGAFVAIPEAFAISRIPGVREVSVMMGGATAATIAKIGAKTAGDTVATALVKGILPKSVATVATRWGASVGIGVMNEVFQESMQVLGVELSKTIDQRINDNPWERMIWDDGYAENGQPVMGLRNRFAQVMQQSALSYGLMGLPGTVAGGIVHGRSSVKAHKMTNARSDYQINIAAMDAERTASTSADLSRIGDAEIQERTRVAREEFLATPSPEKGEQLRALVSEHSKRKDLMNINRPDPQQGNANKVSTQARLNQTANELSTKYQSESIWQKIREVSNLPDEKNGAFIAMVDFAARSKNMDIDQYVNTLFQDEFMRADDLGQNRGATMWSDSKALIKLGQNHDFSTLVHEYGHVILPMLEENQMAAVEQWWSQNQIEGVREQHESFARALEYYLREGKAPTEETQGLFSLIKEWMKEIYNTFRFDWEFTPEIRQVFDAMFIEGKQPQEQTNTDPRSAPSGWSDDNAQVYSDIYNRLAGQQIEESQSRIAQRAQYFINQKENLEQIKNNISIFADELAEQRFNQMYENGEFAFVSPEKAQEMVNQDRAVAIAKEQANYYIPDDEFYQSPTDEYMYQAKAGSEKIAAILDHTEWIPDSELLKYLDGPLLDQEMERRNTMRQLAHTYMERLDLNNLDESRMYEFIVMESMNDSGTMSEEYLFNIWQTAKNELPENIRNPEALDQAFVETMSREKMTAALQTAVGEGALSEIFADKFFVTAAQNLQKNRRDRKSNGLSEQQYKSLLGKVKANPALYRQKFTELAAVGFEAIREVQLDTETTIAVNDAAIELHRMMIEDQYSRTHQEQTAASAELFDLRKRYREVEAGYEKLTQHLKDERHRAATLTLENRKVQAELETLMKNTLLEAKERARIERAMGKMADSPRPLSPAVIKKLAIPQEMKDRMMKSREIYESQKQTRAEFKKEIQDKYKAKLRMESMMRSIVEPPSWRTIDFSYAQLIRKEQEMYPMRETEVFKQAVQDARELAANTDDPNVKAEAERIANMKPLSKMTGEELTAVYERFEDLKKKGRKALREKQEETRSLRDSYIEATIAALGSPEKITGIGSIEASKEVKSSILTKAKLAAFRPWAAIEMLAGDTQENVIYDLLWRETNRVTDLTLTATGKRIDAGVQKMKEIGVTEKQLRQRVTVDGRSYTRDELIGMYLLMKNEQQARALQHGNRISIEALEQVPGMLTDAEKKWAQHIHDDFQENYDRIRNAYIQYTNRDLDYVQSYFPLIRTNVNGIQQDMIVSELMSRSGAKRQYVEKKFTIARKDPDADHQSPVRIEASRVWEEMVARQEKFINQAQHIKTVNQVFSDTAVQSAFVSNYGEDSNQWIKQYTNDITNSNFYRRYDAADSISRMLRTNFAASALAFNPITMLRQASSVAYALHHAGPVHMAGATAQFMANPQSLIEFANDRSPQMKYRSSYKVFEELKADMGKYMYGHKKLIEVGMSGIQAFDRAAVTIVWKAVYDANSNLSENQRIEKANQAILETQPASRAKDLSALQRGGEGLQWFMMFSNQLSQIFSILGYRAFHTENPQQLMFLIAGMGVGAMTLGAVDRKRMPETLEEFGKQTVEDFISQVTSSVPIVGPALTAGAFGGMNRGVDPIPAAGQLARTVTTLFDSEKEAEDKIRAVAYTGQELSKLFGLPGVQARRIYRTAAEADPWEFLGGRR